MKIRCPSGLLRCPLQQPFLPALSVDFSQKWSRTYSERTDHRRRAPLGRDPDRPATAFAVMAQVVQYRRAVSADYEQILQLQSANYIANLTEEERQRDRKSTRLNSSHMSISYAV